MTKVKNTKIDSCTIILIFIAGFIGLLALFKVFNMAMIFGFIEVFGIIIGLKMLLKWADGE